MSRTMKRVALVSLGGMFGAGFVLLAIHRTDVPPMASAPAGPVIFGPLVDVPDRSLEQLADRVRQLEDRVALGGAPVATTRTLVETASTVDLDTMIRKLEAELGDLRARVALSEYEPHLGDDPDEQRNALECAIGSTEQIRGYVGAITRMPLRLRLLEGWPEHASARSHLGSLINDCVETNQLQKAMAAVERFGPLMGLRAWDLDVLRLRAAYRDSDRITIARRVASGPADLDDRAWAMEVLATSLARTGQREDALATIDGLVTLLAGSSSRRRLTDVQKLRAKLLEKR